ncbi:Uu.00g026640.m01.CDS01 [Anthostomella pinea]|uniref:Uu.00g026640.m01.CDS01 n=1 Tax=Anthostomella pinea TaxID=933095 RepID=A0AAI8V8K7_9PEZI|nr:Uu.00g026640.m01.CDS01 [Anthostomella pinea]
MDRIKAATGQMSARELQELVLAMCENSPHNRILVTNTINAIDRKNQPTLAAQPSYYVHPFLYVQHPLPSSPPHHPRHQQQLQQHPQQQGQRQQQGQQQNQQNLQQPQQQQGTRGAARGATNQHGDSFCQKCHSGYFKGANNPNACHYHPGNPLLDSNSPIWGLMNISKDANTTEYRRRYPDGFTWGCCGLSMLFLPGSRSAAHVPVGPAAGEEENLA